MTGAGYSDSVAAGSEFPVGAVDCSGPGLTSPGESLDVWVDLVPGRHALTCWFRHTTADGRHLIHVTQGPARELRVVEEPTNDSTPRPDAEIRLVDFRMEMSRAIEPGLRTLLVRMPGPSMHEMDLYRLHEGRTLDDLKAWYHTGRKSPSPATAFGGVLDSHDSLRTVWLRREFPPGRYVGWRGMDFPAPPDTKPMTHADAGMILEFTVGK